MKDFTIEKEFTDYNASIIFIKVELTIEMINLKNYKKTKR